MRNRTMTAVAAIAAAGALVLTGCTDSDAPDPVDTPGTTDTVPFAAGTTMARLADEGAITIGTKFDQPLFGLADAAGNPVGFDVEIGKLIARHLGIPETGIDWVEAQSANREPYIEAGRVDIVIATYTINDARKEVISFAGPYYIAGQDILVPAGNPNGITGPEWFAENPDSRICTVSGSTSLENISEYTSNILEAGGYSDCLEPIRRGNAVALTTDNVILAGLAAQNEGEFEVLNVPFTAEPYGIGLAKDDADFRAWINDVLEASFADGSWAAAWNATAGVVLPVPDTPTLERY